MTVPPRPSRRAVLVAGLLLPVAGCTRSSAPDARESALPGRPSGTGPATGAPPDAAAALRAAAGERERTLLALYDEVLSAGTAREELVRALREEHAAHLVALGLPSPDPAPAPAPAARSRRPDARQRLDSAERRAADQHARDAVAAPRELAAVLAQLAAAEDSHRTALAGVARE